MRYLFCTLFLLSFYTTNASAKLDEQPVEKLDARKTPVLSSVYFYPIQNHADLFNALLAIYNSVTQINDVNQRQKFEHDVFHEIAREIYPPLFTNTLAQMELKFPELQSAPETSSFSVFKRTLIQSDLTVTSLLEYTRQMLGQTGADQVLLARIHLLQRSRIGLVDLDKEMTSPTCPEFLK